MEGRNGEVTNMNNNNNNKPERPEASSLTRRLGSGRTGSGGRLDDASWIQTRESRSRDPGLLHTLQREKTTPKRLSTGSDDSGWIKATPSSATRRSTGSDDLWLRSPQRMRRVPTDTWSSSGSGSGASGAAAAGTASDAGSGASRGSASGASSGATSSVVNRWNASILEPGKLRIKAEDAKSWIKSDIKDTRSGSGRLQHNPEPIRAIHVPELALRSTDSLPVREAKLRPSDMGDVKLRLQSFEQGILQSDSIVRARERSRDRDWSLDRETQLKAKEETISPRADIMKSAIAKFDVVSSSNKNTDKPETDKDSKYERRLRTVRTHRKEKEDESGDKNGLTAAEDGNQGQADRSRHDQGVIRREDVTVITGVNQGDPNNGEIENISVPHERPNPTAARATQEEGVVSTSEGTSRKGRRRRRHDPPTDREERMPIKEARIRGHDGEGIEVDAGIKRQEATLTVTDTSTVTHHEPTVKGLDTVTVTESTTTIETTDSLVTGPLQSALTSRHDGDSIGTGSELTHVQITREENGENKENDLVPTEETYTTQGSITLSSVSPTMHHTDTVTLRHREAAKDVTLGNNDGGEKVAGIEETASIGGGSQEDEAAIEDNGRGENKTKIDTDVQIAIESTTPTIQSGMRGRSIEDGAYCDQEGHTGGERSTPQVDIRNVIETKTEECKTELISEVHLQEVVKKEEGAETEDEAPGGESRTGDVSQEAEDQVTVTEVTYTSHHTEGEVDSARGEDDIGTQTIHTQSTVTTDIQNTVTNAIENDINIGVTNNFESSVTNDLEEFTDSKDETLQPSTVGLTPSTPSSDSTKTDSLVEGSVLETTPIVIEARGEAGDEDTLHHTYTGSTSAQGGAVQREVIHVGDGMRKGVTSDTGDLHTGDLEVTCDTDDLEVTSDTGDHHTGDHQVTSDTGDHTGDLEVTCVTGDQDVSVSSMVTEDINYVTDDSDNNEQVTETQSTQTTITVSQHIVQGHNLHGNSETGRPTGEHMSDSHGEVLEASTQGEVVEEVIHTQEDTRSHRQDTRSHTQEDTRSHTQDTRSHTREDTRSTGQVSGTSPIQPVVAAVNQEGQSQHATDYQSTPFYDEDINLAEGTEGQQKSQKQEEVTPTEGECDRYQDSATDTMITTETIQLRCEGKTEEESAIKIIVTQVQDISGESEEDAVESESRDCDGECRETEEVPEVVTVRECVHVLSSEGDNDINSDKVTHTVTSTEAQAGTEPSGSSDIIILAQGDRAMTPAGEHSDETESEVTRRVENEPNGVYHDHYPVGEETWDNTHRAEEQGTWPETSETTQAEQSIHPPTQQHPSIEITSESRGIDMSAGDLTIGAALDQDPAGPCDEKSVSYLCEDYVYIDTPPAHSDAEEAHGDHQIPHGSKTCPGSFGSQHEIEQTSFDVNEDEDNCAAELEPGAVNVLNTWVGSEQKHTHSHIGHIEEHTEYGIEDEMASYQHYTKLDDNLTDNLTHSEGPIEGQTDYTEGDRALLSQGYSRLEEEDDDEEDDTITQVIYMDDIEIPSDNDSNSEGGEYAENDTEEEMLDSDDQEDADSDGNSERIEYPWGMERPWGLETIQERPEGLDSDREEEKRAPLAQMESSDDDEWIEEYTFIHHEPEQAQAGSSEEQVGETSEEIPLITTEAQPRVDTQEDILTGKNTPEEESSLMMEYMDESLQEGFIEEEDIHREIHQGYSEHTIGDDIEEQSLEEGLKELNDFDDIIPQLNKSLSSQQETTGDTNTDHTCSEEDQDLDEQEDHDAVDGSVSSSLHLLKHVNIKEQETECSETEIMKAETEMTIQGEENDNNNNTSGYGAQSDDEGVTEVAEVMSLAVLSEAILSLHTARQDATELKGHLQNEAETADLDEVPVREQTPCDSQSYQDGHTGKLTDESMTAIAETISSVAISEAILFLQTEKPTQEETNYEESEVPQSEPMIADLHEAPHGDVSPSSDGAATMLEETHEAVSDVIISEASVSMLSSPIVEDGTADDNVSSADSERDSDSEDSSEAESQRPDTINDATLGLIADYMSSEVMSEVLVSLQSHLEELEDEESEAMESAQSHGEETEDAAGEQGSQHEGVGGDMCEQPDVSCDGPVDVELVQDLAEGMSQALIDETMVTLQQTGAETMVTLQQTGAETMATLQQTGAEGSSEDVSADGDTLNVDVSADGNTLNDTNTSENTLDNKLHCESTSSHYHVPHLEDQTPGIESSEARNTNVESVDTTSAGDAEQEAAVVGAKPDMVRSTVDISETITVSTESDVSDVASSTQSAHSDADTDGQQVQISETIQEISENVENDTLVPSCETESSHDDKSSVVLSVGSVTMSTSEVNSEGQTKDTVQGTSEVPPCKTDSDADDEGSVEGENTTDGSALKVAHIDSPDQDSPVKKSKTATEVVTTEEAGTRKAHVKDINTQPELSKAHVKDINIQPELSKRERTRLLRETRSRLSRTVTNKEQQRVEDTARYRRPRKPPPTEEELQMKQLVTWLCSSPARTGDSKHRKMLNGDEDAVCYDTLILEVFEESDTIFFPIVQQKEARAFVKALHMKGVAYEALCQEVGEHEHNFTSWRKSLGRAGIGHAVMQWANRPLQDLLDDEEQDEDDGMDDADMQAEQDRKVEEERLRHEEGQRRLQGTTDTVNKEVDHNKNDQKDAHDQNNSSSTKSNGVTMRRPKETSPPPTQTKTANDGKPPRQKYEQEPDPIRSRRIQEFKKAQEKDDADPVQDIRKRISLFEKQQSPSKSGSESREDSENGEPEEESRTETESISSGSMDEPTESSPEPPSEPRPKSPEPPLVVEEVTTVRQETVIEEVPHQATTNGRSTREATPKDTSPPLAPADDNKPTKDQTDSSGSSLPDVNENYNSDLDPDNDMHSPVQAIAAKKIASSRVNKTWSGFIFVFSDTPANSETCRVKVGASAFPHKRLRQAQLFNPDMYQVHTVAVKQRSAALEQVLAELHPYRLPGQKDWFEGPFNDLLAAISDVAARFPSSRKIIDDDGDGESAC